MSYNNTHMLQKNIINFGVRHGMVKLSTNKSIIRPENETYTHLKKQLRGIHTWEQLKTHCIAEDLYGNTKFSDFWILSGYFYRGLHQVKASREIGYATYINKNGYETTHHVLEFRLRRMNVKHLFCIIKTLLDKKLISMGTIQNTFEIDKELSKSDFAVRRGKYYKFYAKWFINDGLVWFENEGSDDPFKDLSEYLGISEAAVNFWSTIQAESVLINKDWEV